MVMILFPPEASSLQIRVSLSSLSPRMAAARHRRGILNYHRYTLHRVARQPRRPASAPAAAPAGRSSEAGHDFHVFAPRSGMTRQPGIGMVKSGKEGRRRAGRRSQAPRLRAFALLTDCVSRFGCLLFTPRDRLNPIPSDSLDWRWVIRGALSLARRLVAPGTTWYYAVRGARLEVAVVAVLSVTTPASFDVSHG